MTLSFIERIKQSINNPTRLFNTVKKEKKLKPTIIYHLIINVLIYCAWRIPYMLNYKDELFTKLFPDQIMLGGWIIIGAIFSTIIITFLITKIAELFKRKNKFNQLIKTMIYAQTPSSILGWIQPGIFAIWSLILQIKAIKNVYKMSTIKAIIYYVTAIMIIIIIIGLIINQYI